MPNPLNDAAIAIRLPQQVAQQSRQLISDLVSETHQGVRVLRGIDPSGAQKGRMASKLAQLEIWAHGGPITAGGEWGLEDAAGKMRSVQKTLDEVVKQEKVQTVLISACNMEKSIIQAPEGTKVIQGLGLGRHASPKHAELVAGGLQGGWYSWQEGIVLHSGKDARIYSKQGFQALMNKRGLLPMDKFQLDEKSTISIFRDASGKTRMGLNPGFTNFTPQAVLKHSMPIEEVPFIEMKRPGGISKFFGKPKFAIGGEEFGSLEEATAQMVRRYGGMPKPIQLIGNTAGQLTPEGIEVSRAVRRGARDVLTQAQDLAGRAVQKGREVSTSAKSAFTRAVRPGGVTASIRQGADAIAENVEARTVARFGGKGLMGIVLGGALLAGAIKLSAGAAAADDPRADAGSNDLAVSMTRTGENREQATTHVPAARPRARIRTHLSLSDHELNFTQLDEAFARHTKTGTAYARG